jgi:hypothetical protein
MVVKMAKTTGSSRTHGVQAGERKVLLELREI